MQKLKRKTLFAYGLPASVLLWLMLGCQSKSKKLFDTSRTDYYANGNIKSVVEYDSLGMKHGQSVTYFENGGVKEMAHYKNGKLDGDDVEFFENHKVKSKVSYLKGKPNGIALTFFESGSYQTYRTVSMGKDTLFGVDYRNSFQLTPSEVVYFNSKGELVYKEYLDENGKIIRTEGESKKYSR